MNYQSTINIGDKSYRTLRDILPESGELKLLIVGRTPSLGSIEKGHYFQGTRGKSLWKRLNDYGVLKVPQGAFADDYLLDNDYGIIHLSQIPREYLQLDTHQYHKGYNRLMAIVRIYRPKLLLFSYKNALDGVLAAIHVKDTQTKYGFNPQYEDLFDGVPLFVFPMPGTPCTKTEAQVCMDNLVSFMKGLR